MDVCMGNGELIMGTEIKVLEIVVMAAQHYECN